MTQYIIKCDIEKEIEAESEDEAMEKFYDELAEENDTLDNHTTIKEQLDTWKIIAELTVFAGDMDKADVIANAEKVLEDITDGTDFAGYTVIHAKRDEH